LKKQFYISSLLLIIFISIVNLSDYSAKCAGKHSDKQFLEIQKLSIEKGCLEAALEFNLWDTVNPSAYASLPDGTPIQKNINLFGLFLNKILSNPSLIDLPPPTSHI